MATSLYREFELGLTFLLVGGSPDHVTVTTWLFWSSVSGVTEADWPEALATAVAPIDWGAAPAASAWPRTSGSSTNAAPAKAQITLSGRRPCLRLALANLTSPHSPAPT